MGSSSTEAEVEQHSSIPKLPLMSIPPQMQSPERSSGMLTPPLHASPAAVPFRWEQEPGKPIPCTTALLTFIPKSLELPPRLLLPDVCASNRFLHYSPPPSFRIMSNDDCYGASSERGMLGAMALCLTRSHGNKDKGWWLLGYWRRKKKGFKVKRDIVTGGSHVFPSSVERKSVAIEVGGTHNEVNLSQMKRSGSFSNGKSHFWTTIYGGLKQVVPWSSKKLGKDGSGLRL